MKKVLLLNPPSKHLILRDQFCSSFSKADYYWPPVDLILLSGILSPKFDIKVIDAVIEGLSDNICLKRIVEYKPDAIVFLTSSKSFTSDFSFCRKVKETIKCRLVTLGDIIVHAPELSLKKFPFIDAAILDFTSSSIVDYLNGDTTDIDSICYRNGNEIVYKQTGNKKTFEVPVPRHDLFPLKKYKIPHGKHRYFTTVLTNYGCPYKCYFCVAEKISFKYRPIENLVPELQKLTDLGIREIFFKDFTFGIPREIAYGLCRIMKNDFPHFSWISSSRVDVVDEDLLKSMKEAGCHTIQFGVESASQTILDKSLKQINVKQIIDTFELCSKIGIRTLAHFILGLPGENEETVRETINLAKRINCDYASFNMAYPIYGTSLREECVKNNWIQGEEDVFNSIKDYPVIETQFLSREKLKKLRNYAVKSFYFRPAYILKKIKSIRSFYDMATLTRQGMGTLFSVLRR